MCELLSHWLSELKAMPLCKILANIFHSKFGSDELQEFPLGLRINLDLLEGSHFNEREAKN